MARKKEQETGTLTKAEEQVMQSLWGLGKGFAGEIAANVEEPKPAYRTVLSIIRILETKGFVSHHEFNGNNQYFPLVSKEKYSGQMLGSLMKNYFSASYSSLVSFFLKDKNISAQDLDDLSQLIEQTRKDIENREK
ncbi:MAG: BlaI/MecI/CopY family transcriptional regulator [Bacteroidales bacterium]|nr:BlaI/MecI/CopY family transcriptional regulator [Candidatus Colimorpha merdihippi]